VFLGEEELAISMTRYVLDLADAADGAKRAPGVPIR